MPSSMPKTLCLKQYKTLEWGGKALQEQRRDFVSAMDPSSTQGS